MKTIDAHTHLENGPLSEEYVLEFVEAAKAKGLKTLHILDHTHRFFEFAPMYQRVCSKDERQKLWFEQKQKNSIREYWDLIEKMKQKDLGIEVKFGLEVCFSPENEAFLREQLSQYPYDFLVGAVHSIDGRLYDMEAWSEQILWEIYENQVIYESYYGLVEMAIESDLFTQIAHPDVIKMYQYEPGFDLEEEYQRLARLALEHHVTMEDNTGAHYRYHHPQVGLDPRLREVLREHGVPIVTASDAHYPKNVARDFELLPD